MSCCGMPRKSDEPEYTMPQPLARLASSWEQGCPGIMRALHEEIATGDWDAVIVAHSSFGFIPLPSPDGTRFTYPEFRDGFADLLVGEAVDATVEARVLADGEILV